MTSTLSYRLEISDDVAGQRLDKALTELLSAQAEGVSRARVQAMIEQGLVIEQASGKAVSSGSVKVVVGQVYQASLPPVPTSEAVAQNIPLDIVYEDEDILVINKPAGLVVHPAAGNWDGTLVNALLWHEGEGLSEVGDVARPGIVHRLDKDTSGLMVVARTPLAHQKLTEQFADHSLSRTYWALVWGCPNPREGTIEAAIGRDPNNRQRMAVVAKGGKDAVTHYTVEKVLAQGAVSLVSCQLETGRTHQIRVHLTHIGYPLVGDATYGNPRKVKHLPEAMQVALKEFPRQALHAAELQLIHPRNEELCHYSADLPDDFMQLLGKIGYSEAP